MTLVSQQDIDEIRIWLKDKPFLPQDLDDRYISCFYKGCQGDVTRTREMINKFYFGRQMIKEVFTDRDPCGGKAVKHFSVGFTFPLPKKLPDKGHVIMCGIQQPEPDNFSLMEFCKRIAETSEIRLWENDFNKGEVNLIIDCKDIVLQHLREFSWPVVIKLARCVGSATPIYVKSIHLLRAPSPVIWIASLFKNATGEKIANNIYVHSSLEELYEVVPREMLPRDYGGKERAVAELQDDWRRKVLSYRNKFIDEEVKRQTEARRRPKDDPLFDELMLGNFRDLTID